MSLAYIRRVYNVPAFKGARVKAMGHPGVITGSLYLRIRVRLDDEKRSKLYHPTWCMEYLPAAEETT